MSLRGLFNRWTGMAGVSIRRTLSQATQTAQKRIQFTVLGVVITIALLVVVTGIGIGLVTGTTVYDDDVDYWITPDTDGDQSPLIATDNPQFGSVHETNEAIRGYDGVHFSSPVLTQVTRIETEEHSEYVLVIGVINSPELSDIMGVSPNQLTEDDPYYDDGNYSGEWTGEVILSRSAVSLLEVEPGDDLTIAGNSSFSVVGTDQGSGAIGNTPVAVVQLSELQTVTGADQYDQADQFVVGSNSPAVETQLEEIYPDSSVLTRGELMIAETADSDLPLALALTAFVVAVSVGTLFVLTTNGLEIVADRNQLATMSAIGVSIRSQLMLIGVQTIVLAGIGGVIGSIVGLGAIRAVNWSAMQTLTTEPIAVSHPLFVVYGMLTALMVGMLSLPYLLILTRRVSGGVPE